MEKNTKQTKHRTNILSIFSKTHFFYGKKTPNKQHTEQTSWAFFQNLIFLWKKTPQKNEISKSLSSLSSVTSELQVIAKWTYNWSRFYLQPINFYLVLLANVASDPKDLALLTSSVYTLRNLQIQL